MPGPYKTIFFNGTKTGFTRDSPKIYFSKYPLLSKGKSEGNEYLQLLSPVVIIRYGIGILFYIVKEFWNV